MKLTGYEMETIILYNQAEPNAQVYTHDAKLIAKLRRLHEASPEKVYADFDEPNGAAHGLHGAASSTHGTPRTPVWTTPMPSASWTP